MAAVYLYPFSYLASNVGDEDAQQQIPSKGSPCCSSSTCLDGLAILAWFFVWSQQINFSQLLCMTMALLLQPRFLKTSIPRASSFPFIYCRK
ncbi:hypothetical protein CY35_14G109400 [Sphagnum magellanicum]|nr:hypothetical protein CY35_14G109400 [Sphagnum magellanicum]